MIPVKAVVLAAGLGTRLRPISDRMPKCLAPIAGRPLLQYWLDLLGDAAVRDLLINVHTFPGLLDGFVARQSGGGCRRVIQAYEPRLLGSAGTIMAHPRYADDTELILIIYADNLSDIDIAALLQYHRSHDDPVTMVLFRASDPRASGIAVLDGDRRIVEFTEKPANPKSDLANAGVYVVDAEAYREIAGMKAFDLGFDVLPRFVGRMRGWLWSGYHRDVGTREAYEQAQLDAERLLAARCVQPGERQPGVFLDRDGTLIEQVHYLGDPGYVRVLPGVCRALNRFRKAGYRCVAVTNQSAIGRGLITVDQFNAVNEAMYRQLAAEGAVLDGLYHCPDVPESADPTVVETPERKPGPGMLFRAAHELQLDISRSWVIGDMISDALAGYNAGCAGAVLLTRDGPPEEPDAGLSEAKLPETSVFTATDISAAAETIVTPTEAPSVARYAPIEAPNTPAGARTVSS